MSRHVTGCSVSGTVPVVAIDRRRERRAAPIASSMSDFDGKHHQVSLCESSVRIFGNRIRRETPVCETRRITRRSAFQGILATSSECEHVKFQAGQKTRNASPNFSQSSHQFQFIQEKGRGYNRGIHSVKSILTHYSTQCAFY